MSNRHDCNHIPANSWWENDIQGLPLCRVCDKCVAERLRSYRPEILDEHQQVRAFGKVVAESNYDGVEEQIEADY